MRLLIVEHGANVNHQDDSGLKTPLLCTLTLGCRDAARLLIQNGADLGIIFRNTIGRKHTNVLAWLAEDTPRTILDWYRTLDVLKTADWNDFVAALWFHYFGPEHQGYPPRIRDTSELSDKEFKVKYNWMVHALSSLLFLKDANLLLPHLCRVFHPSVALEPCGHTGKTPLLIALDMFPRQDETEQQQVTRGVEILIHWNPEALKVTHPQTQRIPLTCAIVNRLPVSTLHKMKTCKKETWFKASPLQLDPLTSLPNYLLVAAGKEDHFNYSVGAVYAFSNDYLPGIVSSLKKSPTAGVPHRGIKRSLDEI